MPWRGATVVTLIRYTVRLVPASVPPCERGTCLGVIRLDYRVSVAAWGGVHVSGDNRVRSRQFKRSSGAEATSESRDGILALCESGGGVHGLPCLGPRAVSLRCSGVSRAITPYPDRPQTPDLTWKTRESRPSPTCAPLQAHSAPLCRLGSRG